MKPSACVGCPLYTLGTGYAPACGPENPLLVLQGEALGENEAKEGLPFVGLAGSQLDQILRVIGIERSACRIDNLCRCRPPRNDLVGMPYEHDAIAHCKRAHWGEWFDSHSGACVTLGMSSTMHWLGGERKGKKIAHFHGTVNKCGNWHIVPTFHPSFIAQGNQKFIGVSVADISTALDVVNGEWEQDEPNLLLDPSPEQFNTWVDSYLAKAEDVWLAVDIETPESAKIDEHELKHDASWEILRVNLSCDVSEGVTVPRLGPYMEIIKRALQSSGVKVVWNGPFDIPRLEQHMSLGGEWLDFMYAFHVLQSDLPMSLGFVAPFYSNIPAWKHLSGLEPERYAALDAVQTLRCAYGIASELQHDNMWDVFYKDIHLTYERALKPAQEVGMLLDPDKLAALRDKLGDKLDTLIGEMRAEIPNKLRPLTPKNGLTKKPDEEGLIEKIERRAVKTCLTCGATQVTLKHKCSDKTLTPNVTILEREVPRWYRIGEWNPSSNDHIAAYIQHKNYKIKGKKTKTGKMGLSALVLDTLARKTKDRVLTSILDHKKVSKVRGTYAVGVAKFIDENARVHAQFTRRPSTLRSSCRYPNLQNIVARSTVADEDIATEFRKCFIASPGCKLIEIDYSGAEAVETGWFSEDPNYIRLAKLGVHAYLSSIEIGKPADLSWSDSDLAAYFKSIKKAKEHSATYNRCKRVVHGSSYGLTPFGMHRQYPKEFSTIKQATILQDKYFEIAPAVKSWQKRLQIEAHNKHFLGGAGVHPFGYKHYFWSVCSFRPVSKVQYHSLWEAGRNVYSWGNRHYLVTPGPDAKRVIAFYPQSTISGVMFKVLYELSDPESAYFIGDAYHGKTPLRAIIHDSFLLEVPNERVDAVIEKMAVVMGAPIKEQPCPPAWGIGPYLKLGAEAKIGLTWGDMENLELPDVEHVAGNDWWLYDEDEEDEL